MTRDCLCLCATRCFQCYVFVTEVSCVYDQRLSVFVCNQMFPVLCVWPEVSCVYDQRFSVFVCNQMFPVLCVCDRGFLCLWSEIVCVCVQPDVSVLTVFHTMLCLLWNKVKISRRGLVEQTSIVKKFVKVKSRVKNNLRKWMSVQDKKQGPKNRALGNTEVKPHGLRGNVVHSEGHKPVSDVAA